MLTRRAFARGLALTAAGLLLPAPAAALVEEPARRLWALDGTMLGATPRLAGLSDAERKVFAELADAGAFFERGMLDDAARFADAASKVIALLDQATKDFAVLLSCDPLTVATLVRQAEAGAVHQFECVPIPDRLAPFRPYSRRATLLTARSRPAYLRRVA